MDTAELQLLTSLEDHHWWYRERRAILRRELRRLPGPGRALDIGAAGGGNTRVLEEHGWQAVALEYSDSAADVARSRGIRVMRADARELPARCGSAWPGDRLRRARAHRRGLPGGGRDGQVLQPGGTARSRRPATWPSGPRTTTRSGTCAGTPGPDWPASSRRPADHRTDVELARPVRGRWRSGGNPPPAATLAWSPPWPTGCWPRLSSRSATCPSSPGPASP